MSDQAKQMLSARLIPEEQARLERLWSAEGASWEENELQAFENESGLYVQVLER